MPQWSPTQIDRLLARWPVARLATCRADGRPHLVPVVFAHSDGLLWCPIDGKPKSGQTLTRVRNLARDPRVTLLLDHYADDWRQLWWIRVEGRGKRVEAAGDAARRATEALREKYPQYGEVPLFHGEPALIRIEIEHTAHWCADVGAPVES